MHILLIKLQEKFNNYFVSGHSTKRGPFIKTKDLFGARIIIHLSRQNCFFHRLLLFPLDSTFTNDRTGAITTSNDGIAGNGSFKWF